MVNPLENDEEGFLDRRAAEERQRMQETSCIVKSVHEEMVELYEERSAAIKADSVELASLLKRID